jgi:transposase
MFKRSYTPSIIKKNILTYFTTKSFRKTASLCNVSKSSAHRWWTSLLKILFRPSLQKRKYKPRKSKYDKFSLLLQSIFSSDKLTHRTLKSIQDAIKNTKLYTKTPSLSWIHKSLKKSNISRRRFNTTIISNYKEEKHDKKYVSFYNNLTKYTNDEIICIDETGFLNHNNTCYGYFCKGKQPIVSKHQKRQKINLIMAIHPTQGIVSYNSYNDAINKLSFKDFIQIFLLPNISKNVKAIIIDNISFHHSKDVLDILKNANIVPLYIPPYSPRCNPIEEVFSMMKRKFRSLDDTLTFKEKIEIVVNDIKLYKSIPNNYNHTRRHVTLFLQMVYLYHFKYIKRVLSKRRKEISNNKKQKKRIK